MGVSSLVFAQVSTKTGSPARNGAAPPAFKPVGNAATICIPASFVRQVRRRQFVREPLR